MKIVLLSSLYPPDIAEPAPYVKELAKRLSVEHEVIVVVYSNFPEKINGVRIVAVSKRRPLLIRLVVYFFALLRATRGADILYAENGASVELPAGVAAFFLRRPLVIRIGDTAAHERAKNRPFLRAIERFAFARARAVVGYEPLVKPEILPFEPYPDAALSSYEEEWKRHIETLEKIFTHGA